jgi:hypothetical protein
VAALPLVTHTHQCLTPIHVGQASTAMQTACHAGGPMTGAESGRGMKALGRWPPPPLRSRIVEERDRRQLPTRINRAAAPERSGPEAARAISPQPAPTGSDS